MREAVWGERALGCPNLGLLGGFVPAVQRHLAAEPDAGGESRSWAMAALASYDLKDRGDRSDVCVRLAPLLPAAVAPENAEPTGDGHANPKPAASDARLSDRLDTLPSVRGKVLERLAALKLETIGDLLDHFPRAYHDRRTSRKIGDLRVGEEVTIVGKVRQVTTEKTRNNRAMTRATVADGTGYLSCVWWGNQWRVRALKDGTEAAFSGKIDMRGGRPQISNPAFDVLGADAINTGRVVPIYPASEQLSTDVLRRLLHEAIERLGPMPDPIPAAVRAQHNLLPRAIAYAAMHFPDDLDSVTDARRRLVFEELFALQAALALRKHHLEREVRGIAHDASGSLANDFLSSLPFSPTGAQARAMREISGDMVLPQPMHRLLQGDVGSGKTLVAVYAALVAVQSGNQAAIMAPTEVLAAQHARKMREMLEPLGVDVALLTGNIAAAQRRDTLMRLAAGDIKIACGTHALLTENVTFRRLGIAVIDEQHRFGVAQRIQLKSKGEDPDVLIMTATPIPRTLALTLYGDLDVTVLDELPAGRQPITTNVLDDHQRDQAYDLVRREVAAGRRAYVVCALVDESDALEAKAAMAEAERLATQVFPDLRVGLMHGQMRSADKDRVMREFRAGEITVLISTTVIEVGVDVPEATVMIIEDAERFGLSQLHQLRGRIGRSTWASWCLLFHSAKTPDGRKRLEAVESTLDGFRLAEIDLEIRGEGQLFGVRQAGLADLKLARLVEDFPIIVEARKAAFALVELDPKLEAPQHQPLRDQVHRRFGGVVDWLFHS